MTFRVPPGILAVFALHLVGGEGGFAAAPPGAVGFDSHVRPFFKEHCIRCHGPEKNKGKITLHSLDGDLAAGQELERWETILEVLDAGEMPPEDEPQPDDTQRQAIADWIDGGLRTYVRHASQEAPASTARRLTNFEYQNTVRDLIGFELNLINNLPEDPQKPYHFNNTAEFMLLGPEQVDRYLENARRVMASALVDPGEPEVYREKATFLPSPNMLASGQPDEVPVYGGGRRTVNEGVPIKPDPEHGEYRIRIEAAAILPPGYKEVPLRLVMGSHLRSDSGTGDYYPVGTVYVTNTVDHLQVFEFRGRIENHPFQVGNVTAKGPQPSKRYIYAQNLFDNGQLNDHRRSAFDTSWDMEVPRAVVRSIEFEAPVTDVWPPAHHTRILFDSPLRESDPSAYVRAVLERFTTRAFRRPVSPGELDRFVQLHEMLAPEFDTFEAAMRETLSMVLISPQFLYHTMAVEGRVSPAYELASKLSYFLWGSMPDQELFDLAADGSLEDPAVIEAQVRRLLADERAEDFVENFTRQWLSIDKMHAIKVNLDLFPRFLYTVHVGERSGQERLFRPTIRDYLQQETVGYVGELIRRNAPVDQVIDSEFAYLNEPVAAHYGVDGVKGLRFRPVSLPPQQRSGGLLTHASVLLANSTGSAPHPIYRAVWLREAILGDKVKPPPAEVPALSDSAGDSAENAVSIKELLALHREKESCNDCHVRLDPWGIPFEEYNAIGQYQPKVPKDGTRVRGVNPNKDNAFADYVAYLNTVNTVPVSATARVPHGPEVGGVDDLKKYLLRYRHDDVAENLVRRLATYAVGRELTYRDRFAVEELMEQSAAHDHRLQDLIVTICQSDLFRTATPTEENP